MLPSAERSPASGVWIFMELSVPFISLVFIGSVVGERISLWTIAGLLLVISGIVLQGMRKRE
ncbi:MAG: hypothetical protein KAT09_04990 [Candidatus Aegiribacteria sp.]|nr:hypothetical protein [Candidatus Aegiribacteria sp.]